MEMTPNAQKLLDKFRKIVKEENLARPASEVLEEYPAEEEWHGGDLDVILTEMENVYGKKRVLR